VDFDPGVDTTNLTSAGLYDFFIQKLDSDGNFIWVKQMGGTGIDAGIGITLDAIGNVYTTGYFSDTVDFNPGSGTAFLTCTGLYDTFVQKLDANGNFIWAKQTSSTDWAYGFSITTDANGDVYTMGIFSDTVDFDPGPGTTILIASQNVEVFIQKLDVNGNFIWATQTTGNSEDSDISGSSITTDNYGNVYTTGYFEGTRDFDPGTGTINLTSKGSSDVFIQKLSQTATVGITEYTFTENIQVYPNPTSGNFAIKFETIQKDLSVRIMSISGQIIETRTFQNADFVQLKLEQPTGFYLVEIQNEKGNKTVSRLIKK
jgi:hypothetical protein